ncbi:MAG: hypothetical protein ABI625_12055, partial [bacterium]
SFFDLIVPCGISDVQMSSIARELDGTRGSAELPHLQPSALLDRTSDDELARLARMHVVNGFADVFALEPVVLDLSELERVAATTVPV